MDVTSELRSYGRVVRVCHMCRSPRLSRVIDLGHQPHSDQFPTEAELDEAELTYPLRLVTCEACGLLQIDYLVNPKRLYQEDYLYMSSTTATGRAHYVNSARSICERFSIPAGSLAVDIGSNVGVLLDGFRQAGMRVLGVDPASVPAAEAMKNGIETLVDFFSHALSKEIVATHGTASVITGTNVFAHMHELDDAVEGMKHLLSEQGVIVIEAPHALPLIERVEYDTIYHQHVGYLSMRPMQAFFKSKGLELFDVEQLAIHGGSLRYFVGHPGRHPVSDSVRAVVAEEESSGLYDPARLEAFARAVEAQREQLLELLLTLKREGKRIIALSAPAKGNTLLNYCKIDRQMLDYATEKNPYKVGRYTPGTHIPILTDEHILTDPPDYALILAWNFAEEIMYNMQEFKARGGKFIIPIPTPVIM